MKKKAVIVLSLIFILIITIIAILLIHESKKSFYLEERYYGTNNVVEIKFDELNKLIDKKESFAVFVYQPMCVTSSNFESVLSEFIKDKNISIYKIAFSNIKNTDIGKKVKYYPSFIIFNKGEIIDFLESDKDEDLEYYNSKDGFESWFTKYVKIKKTSSNNSNHSNNETDDKEDDNLLKNVNLENVVRNDNKVNIYFFWGNGCPHCAEEFAFFESIKEKYEGYYNLYTFEVWYNEKNAELLNIFAENMNDKVTGIPYTIIGNKSFTGFSEKNKDEIINSIVEQHKNSYDVYFDKIKK